MRISYCLLAALLIYSCHNYTALSGVPVWTHFFIATINRFKYTIWKHFSDVECVCV